MKKKKEPEEVYFYVSEHVPQNFSFYVFDDQYYYHSKDVYLSTHLKADMENNNVELNKILEKKSQQIIN